MEFDFDGDAERVKEFGNLDRGDRIWVKAKVTWFNR